MKKKLYTQPQTDKLAVAPVSNIAVTSSEIINTATDGMDGAPKRSLNVMYI